jgi:hypothetical protein
MATNTQVNRINQQAADQKLISGITKHAQTLPSLVIGGTSYATAAITAQLQSRLDASTTVQSTRATWQNAVSVDKATREKTKTFVSGLRQALQVAFAGSIDTLADFGLTPRKARVVTPEEKTVAVAKAKATRAARHTMGKKQKAAIKGTVPEAAPATPPAAAVPAASTATVPATSTAPAVPMPGVPTASAAAQVKP